MLYERYALHIQRVGSDRLETVYDECRDTKDGLVSVYSTKLHRWTEADAMTVYGEKVEKLIATESYLKVQVTKFECGRKPDETRTTVIDWEMDEETAQRRTAEYIEYEARRKELKAQISKLQAELRKLDKGFDRVKN